jgi:hypothetical protein
MDDRLMVHVGCFDHLSVVKGIVAVTLASRAHMVHAHVPMSAACGRYAGHSTWLWLAAALSTYAVCQAMSSSRLAGCLNTRDQTCDKTLADNLSSAVSQLHTIQTQAEQ